MAKKVKASAITYSVSAITKGVDIYEGNILSVTEEGVEINYQKPRSPKRINSFFPTEKIVFIEGEVGGEGSVGVLSDSSEVGFWEGATSKGDLTGFVKVTTEDGTVVNIKSQFVEASAVEG